MFSSVTSCHQANVWDPGVSRPFCFVFKVGLQCANYVLAKHTQSAAGCQRRALFISWSGFEVKGANAH